MNNSKQIKFGAILSYFTLAFNVISGFVYTPWMVAQIGKSDYGLYTLANSVITLFLVDFGLSSATGRYISKYRAEGRQDKVDSFLGAIYKLYLIIDSVILVVLIVVYFLIDKIYVKFTPAELEKLKVVYIISASFAILNFPFVTFKGILNSYEKFIQLKIADLIYRVLLIALTVVFLLYGYGLYALVVVHAVVGLIVIAYNFTVIKKTTPVKVNWKQTENGIYKEIFSFSIWVMVITLAQRLVFNITPSILGITANSGAIAVFGIVTTVEGYTFSITTAINGMFMPKISRIYEKGDAQKNIMPLMLKVGKFQYALNGLMVSAFFVIGKSFINLWMGNGYGDAYYGILLVIIPGLFYYPLQIANTAMTVEKKVNTQAYITVIMGVANVAFSFALSRFFGVIGACISIFIAYMIRDIAYIIVYHKVMKFDMIYFMKKCFLKMGTPMIITVISGVIMNVFLSDNGISIFLIKGVITVLIYLLSLWLICLNKNDKKAILKFVK